MSILENKLRDLIRREGRITFARFMEAALYDPEGGYYTASRDRIGEEGDYYTSSVTHPVIGALISLQLEQMWRLMGEPHPFTVVEEGAGKGVLAADIQEYAASSSPSFSSALRYVTVERGLGGIEAASGTTTDSLSEGITGCFLSNELVDAMPTHVVTVREGRLQEIYVVLRDDDFAEAAAEPSTPLLQEHLDGPGIRLAEGQRGEINLEATRWVSRVARRLNSGFVLTIDYGYTAAELYSTKHPRGTLLCYYRHAYNENPFLRVGRQDITSHVDFSALVLAGQKEGLQELGLTTQAVFLNNLGMPAFLRALESQGLDWQEYRANRMSMLELVRPEGMGNFKVLVQGKGVPISPLYSLTPSNPLQKKLQALGDALRTPLLQPHHISLLKGRYPFSYI